MALLDSGTVPLAPSGSTTQSLLPEWYTNYAQDILSRQQAISTTPYATYQPPRIAGFTPDQQSGFDATRSSAMAFQPGLSQATQATQGVVNSGGALAAAQPYLTAASGTSVGNIGQYMNPYTDMVVNRIGDLGARTLREKLLPEISDRFIGAGQFGGTRQSEIIGRALRDTMEGISAQQAEALRSGYGEAAGLAGQDLSRQGALASTAGGFAGQDLSRTLTGAGQLAELAGQQQQLGLTGAGALQTIGQQQQALNQKNLDVAREDFLAQQNDPQAKLNAMMGALQGVKSAIPTATLQEGYAAYNDPNAVPKTSGLQNASTAVGTLLQLKDLLKF
ncbi:hypothetical protein [Caulobacter phage KcrB]|nr:hypothetical protein RW_GP065c [Caulobacter phage RW]WCA46369.1 hypothetical protein [Caulobacter phage KcrB]WCD56304.1 hypothetical protein [Caulobacter phage RLK]WNV48096.1 hypothetical protein GB2A_gp064c [Caulobacter phage GB2A]